MDLKNFFSVFILLFIAQLSFSQSWEDSLAVGKKLYKEGKFKQAYATLKEAQKIAPSDVDLSQDIGNAAYRSKDYEMAEKAFKSAASNDENPTEQANAWHNVGNSQMQTKNYQEAIESYKNALRKNPTDEKTRYNLAEAKRRLKKQQKQQNKNQKDNQDQKQNQQKKNQQNKQNKQQDKKQNSSDKNQQNKQQGQQQNQQNKGDAQKSGNRKAKLSDKKTDRMLDDLLKKEIKTKRKVRGVNSKGNQEEVKSGKKW